MSATKFKVGDRARVRKWEELEKIGTVHGKAIILNNPHCIFQPSMRIYCGKEVVIREIISKRYRIENDPGRWNFTDEMLEPITPAPRWYVGQSVWDDVNHPGEKGTIDRVYDNGSLLVNFHSKTIFYTGYDNNYRFLSAVPYTFSLPPQPEPIWIPEKWERVLVRDDDNCKWIGHLFEKYDTNRKFPFRTGNGNGYKYCIPFDEDKVGKV